MNERIAVGVIWHGGELVFQEREETREGETVKMYALPGGKIEDGEKPTDGLIRELKQEIGIEFKPADFGSLRVIRLAELVGYFRETIVPYGTRFSPEEGEKNQVIVTWSNQEIQQALEDDKILPLSAEYIGRHL